MSNVGRGQSVGRAIPSQDQHGQVSSSRSIGIANVRSTTSMPSTNGVSQVALVQGGKPVISNFDANDLQQQLQNLYLTALTATSKTEFKQSRTEFMQIMLNEVHGWDFSKTKEARAARSEIGLLVSSMSQLVFSPEDDEVSPTVHAPVLHYQDGGSGTPLQAPPPPVSAAVQPHLYTQQEIQALTPANILQMSVNEFDELMEQLGEFFGLNIEVNNDAAREIYDIADNFLRVRFQGAQALPANVVDIMQSMENLLIFNGLFFDRANESIIPNLTHAEVLFLQESQFINLTEHLFSMVSENMQNPALAQDIYNQALEYIETRYPQGPATAPSELVDMIEDILAYAAQFGIQLNQ